jgi:outer membrane protein assembly factor BamB
VAVLAVGALVLSSCDWAQFRYGPEGTGFNPFESTIGASNVSGLQERWSESSGVPATESSPVVANGVVYAFSAAGRLDAFDSSNGTAKWSYQMPPSNTGLFLSSLPAPAVANGVVYATSTDSLYRTTLYAIDANSGTKMWSVATGTDGSGSGPVVANGNVYLTSSVHAFNATNGALLWASAYRNFSTPTVANGVAYADSNQAYLYAFNATTGSLLWTVSASGSGNYGSSPAVANGAVYFGGADGNLHAYDATTGAPLWSAAGANEDPSQSPAVANGAVYESGYDGNLHAYNATTGAPLWSAPTGAADGAMPAVANGVVYVGAGGKLDAFNATTGAPLWSSSSSISGEPAVANGIVYVSANNGLKAYSLPVQGAGLTVSPTFAPDYGTVLDGTSSLPTTFTITNFGSSATTAITDTLSGADPAQFRVTSDGCAGAALAGGASCAVGVAFAPTLPGIRTATLALSAATGGSASASLSGAGDALSIDPAAKDYGTVLDGTSSPPATFTVTNRSTIMVSPTIASLAGSQFTASSDNCSGAALAAGATCSVAVAFTPTGFPPINAFGRFNATLSASTQGVTATANLSGIAQPIAIAPATKDYGTVPVGSSSPATFTVTNVSSVDLSQLFLGSSVAGSGYSITSDSCAGKTLALGASCTIVVTFAPSVTGASYNGQLTVAAAYYGTLNQATLVGVGG